MVRALTALFEVAPPPSQESETAWVPGLTQTQAPHRSAIADRQVPQSSSSVGAATPPGGGGADGGLAQRQSAHAAGDSLAFESAATLPVVDSVDLAGFEAQNETAGAELSKIQDQLREIGVVNAPTGLAAQMGRLESPQSGGLRSPQRPQTPLDGGEPRVGAGAGAGIRSTHTPEVTVEGAASVETAKTELVTPPGTSFGARTRRSTPQTRESDGLSVSTRRTSGEKTGVSRASESIRSPRGQGDTAGGAGPLKTPEAESVHVSELAMAPPILPSSPHGAEAPRSRHRPSRREPRAGDRHTSDSADPSMAAGDAMPAAEEDTSESRRPKRARRLLRGAPTSGSSGVRGQGMFDVFASSQAELGAPSTRWPPVLVGTGLSPDEKRALSTAATRVGGRVATEFDPVTTTHVVTGTVTGRPRACKRTYKYLVGLASGCWIVASSWAEDCMRLRARAPEEDHEIVYDGIGENAPRASREASEMHRPKLLAGRVFFLHGSFSRLSRANLTDIILLAGGQITPHEPLANHMPCLTDKCTHNIGIIEADPLQGVSSPGRRARRSRRTSTGAGRSAASVAGDAFAAAAALRDGAVDTAQCLDCGHAYEVPVAVVSGRRVHTDVVVIADPEAMGSISVEELRSSCGRPVVEKNWVLNSLSHYKILPFDEFDLGRRDAKDAFAQVEATRVGRPAGSSAAGARGSRHNGTRGGAMKPAASRGADSEKSPMGPPPPRGRPAAQRAKPAAKAKTQRNRKKRGRR